jgi:hypothetical protein
MTITASLAPVTPADFHAGALYFPGGAEIHGRVEYRS